MRAREPISFRWEKGIVVILLRGFCKKAEVAKPSPGNVGGLVFLESQKALAIITQSNLLRQLRLSQSGVNEANWDNWET